MVVMAIRLQQSVGGNLSTLMKTVANTLRERVKMARHVKALSAEGRMSWVLGFSWPRRSSSRCLPR